ncbi:hypothetical protein BDY19DRAFT_661523 [Irpex rosettiformis]|uniref:Uncharacterized protein n=1 Tax=Irpex rosettiformis TaxID=378272 RepID=A0ACB8TNB4_9APHY|nr:hypothetical protein BDY19DRAFT_661523 [Irpex rosettiformis]
MWLGRPPRPNPQSPPTAGRRYYEGSQYTSSSSKILEFTGHALSSASTRHNSPCSCVILKLYLFPLANCLRLNKAFDSSEIFASASNSSMPFPSSSSSSSSPSLSPSPAKQQLWLSWPKPSIHGSSSTLTASATYTCLLKRTLLSVGPRCC